MSGRLVGRRWALRAVISGALVVAGCGGDDSAGPAGTTRTLNIHVTSNLAGYPDAVRAEQLAVQDADGRAGRFKIRVVVHDEASPTEEANTDPERVRRNAQKAARDPNAIAYVGD